MLSFNSLLVWVKGTFVDAWLEQSAFALGTVVDTDDDEAVVLWYDGLADAPASAISSSPASSAAGVACKCLYSWTLGQFTVQHMVVSPVDQSSSSPYGIAFKRVYLPSTLLASYSPAAASFAAPPCVPLGRMVIEESRKSGTGGSIWKPSYVMLNLLIDEQKYRKNYFREKIIFEFGSGMGVLAVFFSLLQPRLVIATDVLGVLPVLRRNVLRNLGAGSVFITDEVTDYNQDALENKGREMKEDDGEEGEEDMVGKVLVCEFNWNKEAEEEEGEEMEEERSFERKTIITCGQAGLQGIPEGVVVDVIVCSDCLYNPGVYDALFLRLLDVCQASVIAFELSETKKKRATQDNSSEEKNEDDDEERQEKNRGHQVEMIFAFEVRNAVAEDGFFAKFPTFNQTCRGMGGRDNNSSSRWPLFYGFTVRDEQVDATVYGMVEPIKVITVMYHLLNSSIS